MVNFHRTEWYMKLPVTYHTDREGTYGGNFSNIYPKGTKYYAIQELLRNP